MRISSWSKEILVGSGRSEHQAETRAVTAASTMGDWGGGPTNARVQRTLASEVSRKNYYGGGGLIGHLVANTHRVFALTGHPPRPHRRRVQWTPVEAVHGDRDPQESDNRIER